MPLTPKTVLASALLTVLVWSALLLQGQALLLAVPLLVLLLVLSPATSQTGIAGLTMQRHLSHHRLFAGETLDVEIILSNSNKRSMVLSMEDLLPEQYHYFQQGARWTFRIAAGETKRFHYQLSARRGHLQFEAIKIISLNRALLAVEEKRIASAAEVWVYPQRLLPASPKINPRRRQGIFGPLYTSKPGLSDHFLGLRDYQIGDPIKKIHWRASARQDDRLLLKQYEQEQIGEIFVVVDARQEHEFDLQTESLLDKQCSVALALAQGLIREGHRVGLATLGNHQTVTRPRSGRIHLQSLQESLTKLESEHSRHGERIILTPKRYLNAGSSLLWVSYLDKDDERGLLQLQSLGYDIRVVVPDPALILSANPEMENYTLQCKQLSLVQHLRVKSLRARGISTQMWQPDTSFESICRAWR